MQQIEGENWRGEKMDKGKVDKMSGEFGQVAPTVGGWGMCGGPVG